MNWLPNCAAEPVECFTLHLLLSKVLKDLHAGTRAALGSFLHDEKKHPPENGADVNV